MGLLNKINNMKNIEFPRDFERMQHQFRGGEHFCYPNFDNAKVSIVFGKSFYSNGIDTYEMFDFRKTEPIGYMSIDDINDYLSKNPF